MKRVLLASVESTVAGRPERVFGQSMLISAVRCTLSYIVFPFILPVVGITAGINSTAGLIMGGMAVAANALSIRRFWSADHKYKVPVSALNLVVIVLLAILAFGDVANL